MNYKFIDVLGYTELARHIFARLDYDFVNQTQFYVDDIDQYLDVPGFKAAIETVKPWHDILAICYITIRAGECLPIHTDTGVVNPVALNLPIYNCEQTYSVFYKPLKSSTGLDGGEATGGYLYHDYAPDSVTEIDRFYFTQPVLFNTSVPHSAYNLTDKPRVAMSIRFKTEFENLQ